MAFYFSWSHVVLNLSQSSLTWFLTLSYSLSLASFLLCMKIKICMITELQFFLIAFSKVLVKPKKKKKSRCIWYTKCVSCSLCEKGKSYIRWFSLYTMSWFFVTPSFFQCRLKFKPVCINIREEMIEITGPVSF